jgi:purine-binding chemotaxis protein CheW
MTTATRQYCTVRLGELLLGIAVLEIQEVIRAQPMTQVPLAGPAVRGLINLRGHIVTAVDLRERLGLDPRPDGQEPMNVVVRTPDEPVSLLVDAIGDVLEVVESDREAVPATVPPAARAMVTGVYQLPGRLLLALDTAMVLDLEAMAVSPGAAGPTTRGVSEAQEPCLPHQELSI